MPAVRTWAEAGHESLREITRDHIQGSLPHRGNERALVGQALRSLFTVLKARRLIFVNAPLTFGPENRKHVSRCL
jgi:hypothetical protein